MFPLRLLIALLLAAGLAPAQRLADLAVPRHLPEGQTLVLGFLGAWERWDDSNRSVRKLALSLRGKGFAAESFGNHNLRTARKLVLQSLDRNRDKKVDPAEAAGARVILYGQSMGGAAAVKLARDLHKRGIPVLLTVQVDSWGLRDAVIPPNVRNAANYYQAELLSVRGENAIRAADPAKTRILGNFEKHYPLWLPNVTSESWARRTLGGAHAKMESDPVLWAEIETLILATAKGL
jgi:pimeloyl-ACP methyl ester carboxylesterase